MQLKQITVATEIYAVIEHSGSGIEDARTPGVVLSSTPWRSRHSGRGSYLLESDPEGSGYGKTGHGYIGGSRGLLVLVPTFNLKQETALDELASRMVDVAAGVDLSGPNPTAPQGYRFAILRPQAVVATWAERLEYDRVQRERAVAANAARDAQKKQQSEAREQLVAVLGGRDKLPYVGSNPNYVRLLEFAEAFHAAKLAETLEDNLRAERRAEDLREEDAAHDVYGTHS